MTDLPPLTVNPFAGKALDLAKDIAIEMQLDIAAKCPSRPSLPHEREEYGDVRWLTVTGQSKYDDERWRLLLAWEQAGFHANDMPDPLVYS